LHRAVLLAGQTVHLASIGLDPRVTEVYRGTHLADAAVQRDAR
jgi:hypothetical protein